MKFVKAHAYGNDFLLVADDDAPHENRAALARAVCERHTGIGADGLIFYHFTDRGAAMQLLNADGSPSEVSGNGVRCLGAWLTRAQPATREVTIDTDAGPKRLTMLGEEGTRLMFRAAMGSPQDVRPVNLRVGVEDVRAIIMRVGNPQCVVLGAATEDRLHRLGGALARHDIFPEGTNVEFADVLTPDTVRILIWERGVGPTEASGTGACAAAVAAAAFGGAARDVQVIAPGGSQRVEWRDDGLYLTGWAEILFEGQWLRRSGP